jgi:uncharacterized protein (DUF1778 family)
MLAPPVRKEPISVRVSPDVRKRIEEFAKARGVTLSLAACYILEKASETVINEEALTATAKRR